MILSPLSSSTLRTAALPSARAAAMPPGTNRFARRLCLRLVFLLLFSTADVVGADTPLAGEWFFWPSYTLPQRAANYAGPRVPPPADRIEDLTVASRPLVFRGEQPSSRLMRLVDGGQLPDRAFSVELWIVNHVNQPVGALVSARGEQGENPAVWAVGYHSGELLFALTAGAGGARIELRAPAPRGWKRYWHHVVATVDGRAARLYHNGELVAERALEPSPARPPGDFLEAAAYLGREPHMELGNLLRELRLHRTALAHEEIRTRLGALQRRVDEGIIFPDLFHFNAGPSLHLVDRTSIRLAWETDRPATARIRYGSKLPLDKEIEIADARRIQTAELRGLAPASPYFYEVEARDDAGAVIRSGVLTFQTAVGPADAWSFAILGDTEARPHVNDRLAKAIWSERPNFLLLLGDLTDGGQRHHKFEWNYEYFLGMNQLIGRVPVFPVPGNGESDLHWYNQYHSLPLPRHCYSFRFGNAEFFMLDSNRPMAPGSEQYAWLEARLADSTARWKIACHHHPTYSSDEDDYGNSWQGPSQLGDAKVRSVVPLYERYGVDLVFFGHLHSYERSWPVADGRINLQRGVRYIQAGGGGGNLEDAAPTRSWFTKQVHRGHHYGMLEVHGDELRFRLVDIEGRLRDMFEVRKPDSAPVR